MYRCENFSKVPRNQRRAALELGLPVWSPFARTGHHAVWADAQAMVWFWDADRAGQVEDRTPPQADQPAPPPDPDAATPAPPARVLPETIFHAKKADGLHLQECHHGFELQHWRQGALADSYWQPERPSPNAVEWFARRADAPSPEELAAAPAAIAAAPWKTPVTPGEWLRQRERALVIGGFACFLAFACWQQARIWKANAESAAVAAEVTREQDALGPALRVRDETRQARARNRALTALLDAPSQAELMNLVDRSLPAGVELKMWAYQSGQLTLILVGSEVDAVACVKALSRDFDDVRLARAQRAGQVDVTARVRARRALRDV